MARNPRTAAPRLSSKADRGSCSRRRHIAGGCQSGLGWRRDQYTRLTDDTCATRPSEPVKHVAAAGFASVPECRVCELLAEPEELRLAGVTDLGPTADRDFRLRFFKEHTSS